MWKTVTHPYYSPLHFVAIGIMFVFFALGIVLGIKAKGNSRSRDKAMTILGFIFIALEIFKITFRLIVKEGADLTLIPFQICSIPMYLLPFIYFMKEGSSRPSSAMFHSRVSLLHSSISSDLLQH